MIALSLKSRRAYGVLYRAYNDIDIYVEDSIYLGVYERIVNRILGGKAKISKVIPLGPRNIVVAASEDLLLGREFVSYHQDLLEFDGVLNKRRIRVMLDRKLVVSCAMKARSRRSSVLKTTDDTSRRDNI